jgi:hypothetical protein
LLPWQNGELIKPLAPHCSLIEQATGAGATTLTEQLAEAEEDEDPAPEVTVIVVLYVPATANEVAQLSPEPAHAPDHA